MSSQLLQALRLPLNLNEEACTHAISDLVSLTVRDPSHPVSLRNIHDAIVRSDGAAYLEPLDVLPTLLPFKHDGAMDLIRTCASNGSPKELMIVLQETIERLQMRLDGEDHGEDGDEEDPDNEGDDSTLVQTTIGIVLLCSPAISRSRIGRRSALEPCSPILDNLISLISSVSSLATREEARILVTEVARLVQSLCTWASSITNDADGLRELKSLLRELLDMSVVGCAPSIQASLAARAALKHFPRFFVKSSVKDGWEDGQRAMFQAQFARECLGVTEKTGRKPSSFSELVYLAHTSPPVPLPPSAPSDLLCLILNALEANMIVDEALFLLFGILADKTMDISLESAESLCTTLTALASTHMDPIVRQLNLRLLSLTLAKLPSQLQFNILLELTSDEQFPQIRGPALGLLKEVVLEALELPLEQASRNPFATPGMLHIFGDVLFCPNPPDLFSEHKTKEDLEQSLELLRIVDCLSFYYVLLQRDRDNKTKVRSRQHTDHARNLLLRPLRHFLDEHSSNIAQEPPVMVMLSLQAGLDRVDTALRMLDGEGKIV